MLGSAAGGAAAAEGDRFDSNDPTEQSRNQFMTCWNNLISPPLPASSGVGMVQELQRRQFIMACEENKTSHEQLECSGIQLIQKLSSLGPMQCVWRNDALFTLCCAHKAGRCQIALPMSQSNKVLINLSPDERSYMQWGIIFKIQTHMDKIEISTLLHLKSRARSCSSSRSSW